MSAVNAVISRKAVRHNFKRIKSIVKTSRVISVLKANAYGHGVLEMARILVDSDAFGVARLEEALELRNAHFTTPILLMEGFFNTVDIDVLIEHDIQTVIHSLEQISQLETFAKKHLVLTAKLKVWLKIDTGMNRLGISPSQFDEALARINALSFVDPQINFMTHFSCADDLDNRFTSEQMSQFYTLVEPHDGELTLANSAGILAWPESHADWVRPGLLLYGCSPMINRIGEQDDFIAAMTLSTSVIAIKPLAKGENVGYGAHWQAEQDTQLAVIAIGYGDGYPRHAKAGTPVLINGKRYPIVGRVSMDMVTVDLGIEHQVSCGDPVIMWGPQLPVEEIAQWSDTICYELILQLTSRVDIKFVE
ncbi:MAG: alanine racemase [Psychrobium sp.]